MNTLKIQKKSNIDIDCYLEKVNDKEQDNLLEQNELLNLTTNMIDSILEEI